MKGGGPTCQSPFDAEKAFDPSKHPRDANGQFAGAGGSGRAAQRLAQRALKSLQRHDTLDLGRVHGARFSHHAGQDVYGWRHGLTAEFVRHIHNRHDPNTSDRHPITVGDFRNLPTILRKEKVTKGGLTKAQSLRTVIVTHTVGNDTYRAVLSVRKRRQALTLHSFKKVGGDR